MNLLLLSALFVLACVQVNAADTVKSSLLGTYTRVVLSCKNVVQSMSWWTRIGFSPTADGMDRPDSAITMTDGQIGITLVKDVLPSPIIMFAHPNMRMLKDSLDSLRINTTFDVKGPTIGEIRLVSPNGVHLAVRPEPGEQVVPVSGDSNRICGKLAELSIGTGYIKTEQSFWERLDFTIQKSGMIPYAFTNMWDGKFIIGLHEEREIPTVAFSYFAADMKDRIELLRKSGITFYDELKDDAGVTEHAYLLSPDGQLVMLFSGTH